MGHLHGVAGPARRAMIARAATTSVLLSLLFIVVYGSTNWFTAQRAEADVGAWYFAWELTALPYVPLLIVPYMSMDLFFFMAAFLCRSERELRVFARRVVFSILSAAAFFLLMPLKLAWPARPGLDGWFGAFVEQSCTAPFLMEYPHNLFPALHITLCLIVADVYARHTRGALRIIACIWFALIAISTVLTWQHHLVDVAGGAVLAVVACYLFRESPWRLPVVADVPIACCYAVGAALFLALVPAAWPWSLLLLWPALGLGLLAAAYLGLGPGIYRKEAGRVPLSARLLLAPLLQGHYGSLAYYRRRCRAWDELVPGVLIGRLLTEAEAVAVIHQGVTAVLDLTSEFSETSLLRARTYRNVPILDVTAPTQEQLCEAVTFILEEAEKGIVYVHCKIGYARSAAVAAAYLLASRATTVEEAVRQVRHARPQIIIHAKTLESLHTFAGRDRKVSAEQRIVEDVSQA